MKINHDMHIHTGLSLCADKTVKVCDYVSLAKECGCKFVFGSDSHNKNNYDFI